MKPRKPYVWLHHTDRDWNGVSYTGTEDACIRMCFLNDKKRVKLAMKKRLRKWIRRIVLKSVLKSYRGLTRRRKLIEFRAALGG